MLSEPESSSSRSLAGFVEVAPGDARATSRFSPGDANTAPASMSSASFPSYPSYPSYPPSRLE